jgi:PST family polysaccharide transporter
VLKKAINHLRLFPKDIFCSKHFDRDLEGKSVRGGTIAITSQGVVFVLNLGRTIVLARLLTPQDFGLIGMVTVVISFAAIFKDAGLSMATVQKAHITEEQINTLFWVNVLISTILGLGIIACAPLVMMFYDRHELTAVTTALSFSFIIQGFGIQHAALLRRHMRFKALALVQIFSEIIGLTTAIILALMGWNYWALVISTIANTVTTLLMTLFFCPWFPGRIKKGTDVRGMIKFGAHLTGFNFVNFFSRNADNILIGKFIGADALGLYAKAYSVVQLPIQNLRQPITKVAISAFSKIQGKHEQLRYYAQKYTFLLAFFGMPLMIFAFIFSEEIIIVILGEQWRTMNPLFKIFALVGFIQTPANVKGMMLLACGKSKQYMYQGMAVSIIFILAFVIGLRWGVIGVAAAYAISVYLIQIPTFWYTCRHTPLTVKDFISTIYRPALVSILSGMALWYLDVYLQLHNLVIRLVIMTLIFTFVYLTLFTLMPGGFSLIKGDLIRVFQKGLYSKK